jgi:two-component system, response regulator FlrC
MNQKPVLLVEDDTKLRDALAETLRLAGHDVLLAADGNQALAALARTPVQAIVTDYQMQPMDGSELLERIRERDLHLPVLMITAHGSIEHAVRSMLSGATDYLVKPFAAQSLIAKLERILLRSRPTDEMVARDPLTLESIELASRVAQGDTTVLLSGESGTGKEVFARFIHQRSGRSGGPFLAINCAAIPESMLEALLFGHEKGAFTGAHESRPGKFEQAQGGTLLLDEISEMHFGLQAKLLRVLQEREVERIGGRTSIQLNVRVIATSNRDLRAQVTAGRFREDLYYRLSVFPITLPPLRQRQLDIVPLAEHFIRVADPTRQIVPTLGPEAETALRSYSWPGNVRELANLIHRAVILCSGPRIQPGDLRFEPTSQDQTADAPARAPVRETRLQHNLQSVEGQLILDALQRGGGSRKRAAELLGISPRTLRYKIARLRSVGVALPSRNELQPAL